MNDPQPLPAIRVIGRLLCFLAPYGKSLALAVLSSLASLAAGIGLMATSAYLISAAALQPPFGDLQMAVVAVRFFGLTRAAFRYLDRLLTHSVNLGLLAGLRTWLYARIEPLAPALTGDFSSGDLLARLVSDIDTLENFFVRAAAPAITAVLAAAGTAVFLGTFSPSLGVAILVSLTAAGLGIPLLTRALGKAPGRQLVAGRAVLAERLVETVQGAADITAFGRENDWQAGIDRLDREYSRASQRMAWIRGLQAGLSSLAANLGMVALLLLAVPLVRSGALAGTSLALVVLGGLASFEAVSSLPLAAQYLETSLAAARRLFAVADQVPPVQDPPHPQELPAHSAVELRRVSFAYTGQKARPALRNIDLEIPPGRRVAVVGASGAGKTSLAALLLRFWDPTEGEVRLGGVDLRCLRQTDLRRRVGLIAQTTALFNASVLQNLQLANPRASREQVEEAARKAQIHERILRLPQGYDTPLGERGLRLSAGERRRIAVARALLQDPALLILDEPTANLDARTGRDLLETLFTAVFPGRSVLLITHRLAFLDRVDEIHVLHRGVVVERGTHVELLAAHGRYARLVELESFPPHPCGTNRAAPPSWG